ncbi:hypothetical protein WJX79_010371 [Trebouxia sp. C0005]
MSSVSLAESAALVLHYLEGSGFCKTAGTFRREGRKLLASIVAPPSVKSLDTILNEYVQIKEAEIKRKQFAEANPLVNDLLAVIDRHAGRPASQPNEMPLLAEAQHNQQSHQTVGTSRQEDTIIDTANVQACQQPMARVASTAAEQNATPMCQKPPLPLPAIASRHPSSSQHRKGAPRRRVEQNNKVRSPISRVTVPAPGSAAQGASANKWMDLPMTDDGLSCLMHDDAFQQRFAEGLATHLTSGTDLHSSTSHQYDDLLAGLPADPNMAGLLEPLASLDSLYATIFPNRQATQLPTGAARLPGALAAALQTVKSNSVQAMQQQDTLPGLSNLHDSKLSNGVAESAAGQNRKQQRDAKLPTHQQPGSGSRVAPRKQHLSPRQVLASLPANHMKEIEPQGSLAAADIVTQSAALDALPAKVSLQSGTSFDPNAIETFIKSLHEKK